MTLQQPVSHLAEFSGTLARLEKRFGIRVATVAPGVIGTPLWTKNPPVLRMVTSDDGWIEPEDVADVMMTLTQGDEVEMLQKEGKEGTRMVTVEGGMILEVGKGRVHVVDT